jgi:hypothetical protein
MLFLQDQYCELIVSIIGTIFSAVIILLFDKWRSAFLREYQLANPPAVEIRDVNGMRFNVPLSVRDLKADDEDDEDPAVTTQTLENIEGRLEVLTRYLEYSTTSPMLWVTVLSMFVVGPPAWCFIAGYVGMVACCMLGVVTHLMATSIGEEKGLLGESHAKVGWYRDYTSDFGRWKLKLNSSTSKRATWPMLGMPQRVMQVTAAMFSVGTWHEHWVARSRMLSFWLFARLTQPRNRLEFLKASWMGLAVAISICVYCARGYLLSKEIPGAVVFIMWNVLITYSSFGIAGTVFYVWDHLWPWFKSVLDILSVSAKIPVMVSVCVALLQMPGGGCQ